MIITPGGNPNKESESPLFEFSSVSEFGRYVRALHNEGTRVKGTSSEADRAYEWDLDCDLEEAMQKGEQGGFWEEGAKELAPVTLPEKYLMGELGIQTIVSGIVGCAPCVPNLLAGTPDSMLDVIPSPQKRKVLRVAVEVAYPGDTEGSHILNFGKGLLSVIDEIERQGIAVELWAVSHNTDSSGKWRLHVLVKQAGSFWSADTVAFVLCHPAFYRRLGFRFQEAHPETSKDCGYGYGNCVGAKYPEFDVSFGYQIPGKCSSKEGALEYAVETFCKALDSEEV